MRGRAKGEIQINPQDIVGQCLGKYEVEKYVGATYSDTAGGDRMRHWYQCSGENKHKVIQRGQLLSYRGGQFDGN